ncbi:nucleoside phosphatase family-domain-containing protein [Cristinia sonorae]|uniref:guanosine-diphosphatase n=1 Tax=Cristinia sonorae TaxID=1940300 RepID=A0A8K0XLK0_9AGAR|nr:nucleoside phosphatase family-domain-containing protein [Cristinia sonorae]
MLSPRSSNYKQLETGMGSSRVGGVRRFGWKKFVIGAGVIIGLVWVFGPRKEDMYEKYIPILRPAPLAEESTPVSPPASPSHNIHPSHSSQNQNQHSAGDDIVVGATPIPTSVDTDPDLSKTVHCTKPHKPDLPLVQYALMIDAGSTGSRIHIYKFNNCGPSPVYEYEVFKQTKPGLSDYEGKPLAAAESLDVLLDEAMRVVPQALRGCTPVAVKATAGLRLLGAEKSEEILEAIRHRLSEKYPFTLPEKDGVVIMDGSDEGVYAWITTNYLLKTIRADSPADVKSFAVLDLGGASTQIVFEPTLDMSKPDSTLEPGEHKYDLDFAGKKRVLYQHSYLGYGLMRARKSVHRLVDFMAFGKPGAEKEVANPCLAKGTKRVVEVEDEQLNPKRNVTMIGADVGSFESCNRVVELVMAKDAICEVKPCSFNGVYQPSLLETFPKGKIMLLSYFYDRIRPLIPADSAVPIHISTIATLAQQVCLGKPSWDEHWSHDSEAMKELEDRPEYCLDLTFMHALLRLGYEFSASREVELGKQVDGTELGWCLGATIAMVGADLKCRV